MGKTKPIAFEFLQDIFDYAQREAGVAAKQADAARQSRDYRNRDRHESYAKAMRRIVERCQIRAREEFGIELN